MIKHLILMESTLISLRNGGGKSVIVQMIIALFVNKTYRDFTDREFKSYFNTNRPTFLMTEWKLDNDRDRFIAGMMVRKNQKEDNAEEALEMFTFTGSYETGCSYDLDTIPIIKWNGNYKLLKGFAECKNALEEISRERNSDFRLYDMTSQYARGQYFKTLKQYQINHKEWESIIWKVNQKESGLSDLFNKSKDEKKLVENWFLKPIEDKLNQDKNKIEEFRKLTFQFIEQYKRNQSNIVRKAVIEKYFEDTVFLKAQIDVYVACQEDKQEAVAEMVLYIRKLHEALDGITERISQQEELLGKIREDIRRIMYESISYDIYVVQDKKQEIVRERYEQEVRITGLTKNIADMETRLMIYDCSRIYDEIRSMKAEKAELDERLKLLYQESDSSREEIEKTGYTLYRFYDKEKKDLLELIREKEQTYAVTVNRREEQMSQKAANEKKLRQLDKSMGKLENAICSYDDIEDTFNNDYQCNFMRNMLGLYPDGLPEVRLKEMEEENLQEQSKLARLSRKKTDLESVLIRLEQEDKGNLTAISEKNHRLGDLNQELARMEGEKQERQRILRYVGLQEADIDDKIRIMDTIERSMQELERKKAELITEKADLAKEVRHLKEGKTMELPANVAEYFAQHGIEIVYGMEWLAKNGRNTRENIELVEKNPFLPYAVILEKDTFERLKNIDEEIYTSFPVPVIIRSDLEKCVENGEKHIYAYGNIYFFILFNNHLLDKEELSRMLAGFEKKLAGLEKQIEDRNADIRTFAGYMLDVEKQTYSAARYAAVQKDRELAVEDVKRLEAQQKDIKREKEENYAKQKENEGKIEECKRQLNFYADRRKAFDRLRDKYAVYERNKKSLLWEQNEAEELQKKQRGLEDQLRELAAEAEGQKELIRQYKDAAMDMEKRAAVFEIYADSKAEAEAVNDKTEAALLEARYKALTQSFADAIEDLEKRQARVVHSLEKKKADLARKNKKNIPEENYSEVIFHEEQYEAIEKNIYHARVELNDANEINIRYSEKIVELSARMDHLRSTLLEKTGMNHLAAREEITDTDFEKRVRLREYEKSVAEKELQTARDRRNDLLTMEAGVSEFADDSIQLAEERLAVIETMLPDLEQAEKEELERYQKDQKKRLRSISDMLAKQRGDIADAIKLIAAREEYAEDYFSKTFVALLSQAGDPFQLARQYDINRSAYENQLARLQVDLENIDREQRNIEEMFLEYVKDINTNLAMIDRNSAIRVRERTIKMLRIQTPDWESDKEHFRLQLHDFVEFVIRGGLQVIEEQKNLEEYLGNVISTKKLYDDVVGIKNIRIKLYKIEAEREVPITWAEVSANSGGEGFLSAFVILTCLLSYMRRDENDMFTSGEEGKVLIMDNPFAQTYSVHLLKPLMEMAKKTNTQLICLSGIGGDSIYNRFDNIYVLKLADSNIRKGVQRLEMKHIKGAEVKRLVQAEFKTEQASL